MTTARTHIASAALAAGLVGLGLATPAAAAPARPAPPPACTAKGCTVVTRADVDGDGRRDRTSITPMTSRGQKAQLLRTVTATGRVAEVVVPTPWLFEEKAWFGAAFLDGRPGAELVLRTGFGAHTQFFGVYGWQRGRLVAQKDPSSGSTEWWTDGALSVVKGYAFGRSRGAATMTATEYVRTDDWKAMVGTKASFRWTKGAWRKTGEVKVRAKDGSPELAKAYGWHAKGLPVD